MLSPAYIYAMEGDYGPLLSTFVGKVAGTVGGLGYQIFATRSVVRNSARVTTAARKSQTKTASYGAGQSNKLLPQICS